MDAPLLHFMQIDPKTRLIEIDQNILNEKYEFDQIENWNKIYSSNNSDNM